MFFEAIFQPLKKTRYNADAKKLIGKKIALQDGWMVEDGPYKGQQCFCVPGTHMGWIPACDLKEIEHISYVYWKELRNSLGLISK